MDSLRVSRVTSSVKRASGKRLPRDAILRCATLGELLSEIARRSVDPAVASVSEGQMENEDGRQFRTWGMMWHSQCRWLFRRDRPLSEASLRRALRELMRRHAALRSRPSDPMSLFTAVQQALSVLQLRSRGCDEGWCLRLARRCLWAAWPRIEVQDLGAATASLPLLVLPKAVDEEGARARLRYRTDWSPPFHVTLAPFGEGASEGALLRIKVTHMFADGYALTPMLAELSQLLDSEAASSSSEGDLASLLPPVTSAFSLLERRLLRSIETGGQGVDAVSSHGLMRAPQHDSITYYAILEPASVEVFKLAAARLAIPPEIALLTVLGVACALFEGRTEQPVVIVAPQRDEPGASELVGLLADFRLLRIKTAGLGLAGVALQLHDDVRERRWSAPQVCTVSETPFLNFEWTVLEAFGSLSQVVNARAEREGLQGPFQVCVDELAVDTWRLRLTLDGKRYDASTRARFADLVETHLQAFIIDPLAPIWPSGGCVG
eukprot:TRINITY_DN16432_c0_g1_i2.p1 TRINITY_DN16432_c0_g1~~TRINITY_DN16432_c0_g1_i2.p1  ORF type:complete len:494 (+),score=94.33 TRINITY_DN16432_c0_g1_i2:193-1674(+)